MKTIASILALLVATSAIATEVVVHVKGVKENTGEIFIAVFYSEDDWDVREHNLGVKSAAESPVTTFTLNLEPGTYAISTLHDLNGNEDMDYNALRMPQEPWGVSNDAPARFSPPKWKRMKFEVGTERIELEINLRG